MPGLVQFENNAALGSCACQRIIKLWDCDPPITIFFISSSQVIDTDVTKSTIILLTNSSPVSNRDGKTHYKTPRCKNVKSTDTFCQPFNQIMSM